MNEEYLSAVKSQLDEKIFVHSLALQACMGGLYDYFSSQNILAQDEPSKEDWLLAGLIHDIDYSEPFKEDHPNKTREALKKYNLEVSDTILDIVKAHAPEKTGVKPTSKAQWSLFCADSLTGLIMATSYVYPSRKIADVKPSSVIKRFLKEPRFAAGTRRDEVILCEKEEGLNIKLDTLVEICLTSMQKVSDSLGL
ncbi:MAG: HD domain-containing protein [Microgenomates group bacterium]